MMPHLADPHHGTSSHTAWGVVLSAFTDQSAYRADRAMVAAQETVETIVEDGVKDGMVRAMAKAITAIPTEP